MRSVDAAELWRRIIESGNVQLIFLEEKDMLKTSVISLDDLHKIVIDLIDDLN